MWSTHDAHEVTEIEAVVAGAEEEKGGGEEEEDDGDGSQAVVMVEEEEEEEGEEEGQVRTKDGVLVDWDDFCTDLANQAFNEAAKEERELRRRFYKYAAQSIAFQEKWLERGCAPGGWWRAAYEQAMAEFESCCAPNLDGVGPPHWKALLCEPCGCNICHCKCTRECACGVRIAKWGWCGVGETCACSVGPAPRTEEWTGLLPAWNVWMCGGWIKRRR